MTDKDDAINSSEMSSDDSGDYSRSDSRRQEKAARRAARASERASRAQLRADEARRRALDVAREGGILPPDYDDPGRGGAAQVSKQAAGKGTESAPDGVPESREEPGLNDEPETGDEPSSAGESVAADEPRTAATGPRTAAAVKASESGRMARLRGGVKNFGEGPRGRTRVGALALATVLLLGLTAVSSYFYVDAREASAQEEAITAAPEDALEASRSIVTEMFTYDWETVEEAMGAVEPRLTGDAAEEFRTSSRPAVMSAARDERASVFATVAAAGVETVHDAENVTALVMVNRMISTEEEPEAQTAASRLRVEMQLVDDEWRLAELSSI